jgi:putative transposase
MKANAMKNVNWKLVRELEKKALDIDPKIHFNPAKYCEEIEEKMQQIRSTRHCKYMLNYHIVFCPRGRVKILFYEARIQLRKWIAELCREKEWNALAIEIMPDHIHMFIGSKESKEIILGTIKGKTSSLLQKQFPEFKNALGNNFWSSSYYISSVGNVSGKTVLHYIAKQWKEYFPGTYNLLEAGFAEGQTKLINY